MATRLTDWFGISVLSKGRHQTQIAERPVIQHPFLFSSPRSPQTPGPPLPTPPHRFPPLRNARPRGSHRRRRPGARALCLHAARKVHRGAPQGPAHRRRGRNRRRRPEAAQRKQDPVGARDGRRRQAGKRRRPGKGLLLGLHLAGRHPQGPRQAGRGAPHPARHYLGREGRLGQGGRPDRDRPRAPRQAREPLLPRRQPAARGRGGRQPRRGARERIQHPRQPPPPPHLRLPRGPQAARPRGRQDPLRRRLARHRRHLPDRSPRLPAGQRGRLPRPRRHHPRGPRPDRHGRLHHGRQHHHGARRLPQDAGGPPLGHRPAGRGHGQARGQPLHHRPPRPRLRPRVLRRPRQARPRVRQAHREADRHAAPHRDAGPAPRDALGQPPAQGLRGRAGGRRGEARRDREHHRRAADRGEPADRGGGRRAGRRRGGDERGGGRGGAGVKKADWPDRWDGGAAALDIRPSGGEPGGTLGLSGEATLPR